MLMEGSILRHQRETIPYIYQDGDKDLIVIMCHGFGSDKNEVGDMFKRTADVLYTHNIATIRYDQVGHGDNDCELVYRTYQRQVDDLKFICDYTKKLGYQKIILLGFSLGAKVIGDLLNDENDFKMIISWSGAIENGLGSLKGKHRYDIRDDKLIFYFDFRSPLVLSSCWSQEISQSRALDGYNAYDGKILAFRGLKDTIVDPDCLKSITSDIKIISYESDHIFDALNDSDIADEVIKITVKAIIEQK